MKPLKKDDRGSRVETLQTALVDLGYKLPRFGVDGHLGFETLEAVDDAVGGDGDATPNDTIPPDTEQKLLALARKARPAPAPKGVSDAVLLAPGFVDGRPFYDGKEYNTRNAWTAIDTVCLHQMAVNRGKGWRGWDGLAIHVVVPTIGPSALTNDLNRRVAHGHGWNSRSVGFEVEGHFAGVEGKLSTHWTPEGAKGSRLVPMKLTSSQVEGALSAIRWVVAEIAKNGGKVKYVGAHRQSYGRKTSDPGELIWKQIALPAMEEHGLTTAPTLSHHKYPGRPIPEAWDPRQKGVKY